MIQYIIHIRNMYRHGWTDAIGPPARWGCGSMVTVLWAWSWLISSYISLSVNGFRFYATLSQHRIIKQNKCFSNCEAQGNIAPASLMTIKLSGLLSGFSVTRILMKIFKTRSSEIVTECQTYFGFYTVSTLIRKRKTTFLYKLANSQNELCELFEFIVRKELNLLT